MDGVIHRTKKIEKHTFPIGDIIIWGSGLLSLVIFFDIIPFLSELLYGIAGVFVYSTLILLAVYGLSLKTGKKVKVDKQYLSGSIIMVFALFIAMHMGFTGAIIPNDGMITIGEYISYCFSNVTPGGVVFGLPSYLLFSISGELGVFIMMTVLFLIGLVLVINKAIIKREENKILTFEEKPEKEIKPTSFEIESIELYEKLKTTQKELEKESRRKLNAHKSMIGLGSLKNMKMGGATVQNPVSLSEMQTPEGINANALGAAEALISSLDMYNNGHGIPWQRVDGSNFSSPVAPVINIQPQQPAFNSFAQPAQPQPTYSPMPQSNPFENAFNQQPPQSQFNWTPPSPINNTGMGSPMDRRRNKSIIEDIRKQTIMPLDEEPTNVFKSIKYNKPPLELIRTESMDLSQFNSEAKEKEQKLNELFKQYSVRAKVSDFNVAPAVTRFEILPEIGTKVALIENLLGDINFALATNNTRMESPIEGKNAIGIEVPNRKIGTVSIKDLLSCKEFTTHPSPLAICIGKDIDNQPVISDLAEMPHLLVAGTTGSGKSVCINTILTSLVYKTGPEELKLVLIDMKGGVELSRYDGIPHMLVENCIKRPNQAINTFRWLIDEMNRRYVLLQSQRVNNIALYQSLTAYKNGNLQRMPYIVMVIDEVADLMSQSKKEVEDCIQNLAQKSRAAGIHIVLATQRPSVNVISGTIKANIGTRIAFRVSNVIDSRTILDKGGAESLMGRGDMLFMTHKGVDRVQGCYIDNDESNRIMANIRERNQVDFDIELQDLILNGPPDGASTTFETEGYEDNRQDRDPKFVQILRYAVREENTKGTISIGDVQRRFSVGFGRAGRIVDQLQAAGFVGPDLGGNKGREVYATREQVAEQFGL